MLSTKAITFAVLILAALSETAPEQTSPSPHTASTGGTPGDGALSMAREGGLDTAEAGNESSLEPEVLDKASSEANGTNVTTASPAAAGGPGSGPNLFASGLVSEETYVKVELISSYVTIVLSVVGCVLNVFSLAVYVHPDMRSASSTYLAALSLAESLYLFLTVFSIVPSIIFGSDALSNYMFLFAALYISNFVLVSLRRMAFILTFVVSFERFVAVTFPFKYKELRLSGHPARISIAVAVVVIAMHVSMLFKYEIIALGNDHYTFRLTSYAADNIEAFNSYANIARIPLVYIPLLGTLLLNLLTLFFLRRHRLKSRGLTSTKDSSKSDKTDSRTTIAITVSTLLFVSLSLPINIQSLFQSYHPTYGWMKQEHYLFLVMNRMCGLLEIFSNIFDFLAYVILSQKFRATFQRLVCCVCHKEGRSNGMAKTAKSTGVTTQISQVS